MLPPHVPIPDYGSFSHQRMLVRLFAGTNLTGQILLSVLIATIFCSPQLKNHRNPILLNLLLVPFYKAGFFLDLLAFAVLAGVPPVAGPLALALIVAAA